MAIGNRQIGWSQEDNLLWEISKQLDRINSIICTGPCPTTTTTSTTLPICYCYTLYLTGGFGIGGEYRACDGTSIMISLSRPSTKDPFPPPVYICAQEGSIVIIVQPGSTYDLSGGTSICTIDEDCTPTTTTTTTTTTTIPLVNTDNLFEECSEPCGTACPPGVPIYYNVWMTQECIDTFPTLGCEIWKDENRTTPFDNGTYNLGNGDCIVITGGIITDIIPK